MSDYNAPAFWTTAEWESFNTVLRFQQIGFDTTAKDFKVGDGVAAWKDLSYFFSGKAAKSDTISKTDLSTGNVAASPRIRVSRSQSLTLSNSWQRVDFNGASSSNVNTFSIMTGTAKMVTWDVPNKLFKFNDTIDRTFNYTFFYIVSGGVRPVNILYRFVIPSPTPFYFPFPDEANPYGRLEDIQSIVEVRESRSGVIYSNEAMRQYGLGLELKIGSPTLLTGILPPTVVSAAFLIYAR